MGHFNPFTLYNGSAFYATYVKWNGQELDFFDELKYDMIYRVTSVDIGSFHTRLSLQEISTGKFLERSYNSLLFSPLKGYIGIAHRIPIAGEPCQLFRLETPENILRVVNTSVVVGIEKVSGEIWNVITQNTVYTVKLIN